MNDRLNLGCGGDYREGWVNADIRRGVDPDIVIDINHLPLPFADDSFDYVLLDNVLEHVSDQFGVLRDLHRISKPGATLTFRGPHWNSHGAWIDPTHTRPFSHKTFEHYLVADLYEIENVSVSKVRFGRFFPDEIALTLADHIGHVIDEIEVTVRTI